MWRTSRWSRHALSYNDGGGGTEMRTLALVLAMGFVGAGFSSARAEVKAEVVEYRHGDAVLEGYLAYDAAFAGKRPGVLVVHEWMGHNPYVRMRTELLVRVVSSHGGLDTPTPKAGHIAILYLIFRIIGYLLLETEKKFDAFQEEMR